MATQSSWTSESHSSGRRYGDFWLFTRALVFLFRDLLLRASMLLASSSVTLTMPWPCYSKSEIPRQKNNFFGERRIPHSFTCRVDFYRRYSRRNFLMICIYCHFLGSSGALPVVPSTYLDHTCNKYCDLIGSLRVTIFIKNLIRNLVSPCISREYYYYYLLCIYF